jgi:regulator of protease activity HflC (stomatin/prohibitin superfamily)
VFISHGRKRRSIPVSAAADGEVDQQTAETLTAIIRVLAEGEHEEEVERFYNQTNNRAFYRFIIYRDKYVNIHKPKLGRIVINY